MPVLRNAATHRASWPSSGSRPTRVCCGCRSLPTNLRDGRASRTSRPVASPRPVRFASTGAHTGTVLPCYASCARATGRAVSTSCARPRPTAGSGTRPSSSGRADWARTAWPSSLRPTRGLRTTSPTPTATAGAIPGMSPDATAASTCSGRSSTSACPFASTTGTWSSSRGSIGPAGRWISSRTTTSVRSVAVRSSHGATTSSSSPDTRSTSRDMRTT